VPAFTTRHRALPEVRFAWRQRTYCNAAFRQEQFGAMPSRRFPPPWSVACVRVRDEMCGGFAELLGAGAKRLARNGAIPPLRKPRRRPACDLFRGHLRTLELWA
jgi:hypothetical protein